MKDLALFILRVTLGGLLAGHGGQKLFGWFKGPGLDSTAQLLATMGLRPRRPWALGAGVAEFGGGALTLVGLLWPLGPLGVIAAMAMATAKAHWGKPIWVTSGGAELPVTNMAIAAALIAAGPGAYALDPALKRTTPRWLTALALLGVVIGLVVGIASKPVAEAEATAAAERDQARQATAGPVEDAAA